jgi:hypothetical protein
VADGDATDLATVLAAAGVAAEVVAVPATIEERMAVLAAQTRPVGAAR